MGISNLADAVTGRYLKEGEEIVAMIIARAKGGYPDPVTCAALPIIGPSQLFKPISTPIRGVVGEYSDFTPHPEQASIAFLLSMTQSDSWEAFAKVAFDMNKGASIPELNFPTDTRNEEVLGVWAVSTATWTELVKHNERRYERKKSIDTIMFCFRDAIKGIQSKDDDAWFQGDALIRLDKRIYELADGTKIDLPPASSVMCGGWNIQFDNAFRTHWGRHVAKIARALDPDKSPATMEYIREMVGGVCDVMSVAQGLDLIQKPIMPSPSAGQYDNSRHVADISLSAIEEGICSLIKGIEEWDMERDIEHVQGFLERLNELQEKLTTKFDAVKPGDLRP